DAEDAEDAEDQARTDPQAGEEGARAAASTPPEVVEWGEPPSPWAARILSRRWTKVLAAILAIGSLVVLISYLISERPDEPAIMSRIPDQVRSSCTPTDNGAICHRKDGTVVFYQLFDTVAEARQTVSNGQQIDSDGNSCPPTVPPP